MTVNRSREEMIGVPQIGESMKLLRSLRGIRANHSSIDTKGRVLSALGIAHGTRNNTCGPCRPNGPTPLRNSPCETACIWAAED